MKQGLLQEWWGRGWRRGDFKNSDGRRGEGMFPGVVGERAELGRF